MMAKRIFTNDTVGKFYNENFINVKFDVDKDSVGNKIAEMFQVRAYPTFLFINFSGELVHKGLGYKPVKEFIALGNDAIDPEKQFSGMIKKYNAGNYEKDFVLKYLSFLNRLYEDSLANIVYRNYIKTQKDDELNNRTNWTLIKENMNDFNSREFKYILTNKEKFNSLYTADSVDNMIFSKLCNHLLQCIYTKKFDTTQYIKNKVDIYKTGYDKADKVSLRCDMVYYQKNKNWNAYAKAGIEVFNKYSSKNAQYLNEVAWYIYENCTDKKLLEGGLTMAKHSIELDLNQNNADTYAMLYFKLGNKAEALKYENIALELAKKENDDNAIKDFTKNIEM